MSYGAECGDDRCEQCPPTHVWCEKCKRAIPLEECTEVQAGNLTHESEDGHLHTI